MRQARVFLTVATLLGMGVAWAQTNIPYSDPNARAGGSSRRESRRTPRDSGTGVVLQPFNPYSGLNANRNNNDNKKDAAAKAQDAQKAANNRAKTMTTTKATATTGTANRRQAPGQQGRPTAGSYAQVGQVKETTKEMVESMRTRKVKFDAAKAANDPGIVLLNPRKLNPLD